MVHQVIQVEGMTCDHCVETVTQAVGSLQGIQRVTVDLDNNQVTLDYDGGKISLEKISAKIAEAGFAVKKSR